MRQDQASRDQSFHNFSSTGPEKGQSRTTTDNTSISDKIRAINQDILALHDTAHLLYQTQQSVDTPISKNDLQATMELAEGIKRDLDQILHPRQSSQRLHVDRESPGMLKSHARRKKGTKKIKQCYRCGRTKTPCWRSDAHGRRALCNVCGLVQAERYRKSRSKK